jgi:predicted dehydrogenase
MRKIRWGVLGVAKIATIKVIPAMRRGELCEVAAIASRNLGKAKEAASKLGIPKAYGSYEELLADPEIDAIYNPLPNHLHVPWSVRAAEAGKHVLCEKPVGMNAAEVRELIAARDRTGVVIGEAFMVQTHPQWVRATQVVREGRIGTARFAMGSFGYYNADPQNVRNIAAYGGGALMDIGCYPIKVSRMVFGEEPRRVSATMVRDSRFGTDILTSAILEFPSAQCIFTCGTQVVPNQNMQFFGDKGRIEMEIPYNAIPNEVSRIRVDLGGDFRGGGITVEEFEPCDQYAIQGDAFSRAVLEGGAPPVPLEDSFMNMAVIDAIRKAAESGKWEDSAVAGGFYNRAEGTM